MLAEIGLVNAELPPAMFAFKQLLVELRLKLFVQDSVAELLHSMNCVDLNFCLNSNLFCCFYLSQTKDVKNMFERGSERTIFKYFPNPGPETSPSGNMHSRGRDPTTSAFSFSILSTIFRNGYSPTAFRNFCILSPCRT